MIDTLGPDFDLRLKASLDRVHGPTPLPENARFRLGAPRRLGPLRPVLALAGALGIVLVAATALAGSPNPSVWTKRAVNSIETVTHTGPSSPSPESDPSQHHPLQPPAHTEPSEAAHESPEPSSGSQQEPSGSPSPDGHDSATPASSPSPSPSPGPEDGAHESPSPSPSGSHS
jgi:hypothetical protein